jgi:hypothetical protein
MSKVTSLEDIDRILDFRTIRQLEPVKKADYFERNRLFSIEGDPKVYCINWWKNQCYLFIDEYVENLSTAKASVIVAFSHIRRQGTWPNSAKTNLQFYGSDEEVVAVVVIEKYKHKD